jgi:hypothetical protein
MILIGFSHFPIIDFRRSSPVTAIIVGIGRKKENSKAADLDISANYTPAIVNLAVHQIFAQNILPLLTGPPLKIDPCASSICNWRTAFAYVA